MCSCAYIYTYLRCESQKSSVSVTWPDSKFVERDSNHHGWTEIINTLKFNYLPSRQNG